MRPLLMVMIDTNPFAHNFLIAYDQAAPPSWDGGASQFENSIHRICTASRVHAFCLVYPLQLLKIAFHLQVPEGIQLAVLPEEGNKFLREVLQELGSPSMSDRLSAHIANRCNTIAGIKTMLEWVTEDLSILSSDTKIRVGSRFDRQDSGLRVWVGSLEKRIPVLEKAAYFLGQYLATRVTAYDELGTELGTALAGVARVEISNVINTLITLHVDETGGWPTSMDLHSTQASEFLHIMAGIDVHEGWMTLTSHNTP